MATSPAIERPASPPAEHRGADFRSTSRVARIPLLAAVFTIGLALFIGIDPVQPWILLALTAIVGLGADGIIRSHPRGNFHTIADTAPYLFVPVLFTLSAGLFLEGVFYDGDAGPGPLKAMFPIEP